MSTIALPFSFSPNTTILSSQVNSDFATMYNDYNGNISDANVTSLSEAKTAFIGTGHDHSGGSKGALVAMTVVQGRLTLVSSTQIKFDRVGVGARYYLKKSGVWTALTISSAITANNTSVFVEGTGGQNLAASTTYFVYLFDNAGTTTVDFSTTGSVIDATTGLSIKNTDDTRLLVGMVRTNGSSQFQDDATFRGVLTYHNRRSLNLLTTFTADRSTASTTYVELNTEIRASFLTWNDETVQVSVNGSVSNSGANDDATAIAFDGTTAEAGFETVHHETNANVPNSIALSGSRVGLSTGLHYATLLGKVGAGTGTWASATASNSAKVYINGVIRG